MIYILCGSDIKKRSEYIKKISKKGEIVRLPQSQISRELFIEYASSVSLFGDSPTIISENVLHDEVIKFSPKDWALLQESNSIFIFIEESLKAQDEKKYKKYATIEHFNEKKFSQTPKFNTFVITDAFGRHDKVGTWILCKDALEKGIEPEAISGLLFWKIKTMILGSSNLFTKDELKNQSSAIVSLYHRAHRGECDFDIGLEQFILTALSK
jgi:DNA polymerase III delta subunit